MGLVRFDQNPTIADTVLLDILTPGTDGCYTSDPYQVQYVKIFYLEKDFSATDATEVDFPIYDVGLQAAYDSAKALACQDPTDANIEAANVAQQKLQQQQNTATVTYTNSVPVEIVGNDQVPAWITTDQGNTLVIHQTVDDQSNPQYGHFYYEWRPAGMREGNYVVCYSYMPNPAGDSVVSSYRFTLASDVLGTTATPYHRTPPEKYPTLLDEYIPEMYKLKLAPGDVTPDVMHRLNLAVSQGFMLVEDLANQLIDTLNATVTHQVYIPYLANLFNLKLRSQDPTRWRRQVKTAMGLFKQKGTLDGLNQALEQAGVKLNKLTKLWQVISKYTWVDAFTIKDPVSLNFLLTKTPLAIDPANFTLSIRPTGEANYITLPNNYVTFSQDTSCLLKNYMVWQGEAVSPAVSLMPGDVLRLMYQYQSIPSYLDQQLEYYVRSLPLADQRDETTFVCPLKNWNVRVIEEDDPLFDAVIESRHPFFNFLVFGRIRTEFPYSENVYNTDEYNGSKRDSLRPCDIDCLFLDPCYYCHSSKFTVDVEIDQISNDRIAEVQAIVNEYSPFHAILHTINVSGKAEDLIQTPVEQIQQLVQYRRETVVLGGEGQMVFNRARFYGLTLDKILRNALATSQIVVSPTSGTGSNQAIVVYSPDARFDQLGVSLTESVLEILPPFTNAGSYQISNIDGHTATISSGITEPLNSSAFTFRLSNNYYSNNTASISHANLNLLQDAAQNWGELGVKTTFDVNNDAYVGPAWKVSITSYSINPYTIDDILPDGSLVLADPGKTLPTSRVTGVTYTLLDSSLSPVTTSNTGSLLPKTRGLVQVTDSISDARGIVKIGDYLLYSGTQYRVSGFVPNVVKQFYIDGYSGSEVAGVTIQMYRRLLDNMTGYLGYKGMTLQTVINYESSLNIQNGDNPPTNPTEGNLFRQNFLVLINDQYYAIKEINGQTITLDGPFVTWSLAGIPVTFAIYQFTKVTDVLISDSTMDPSEGMIFDKVDRRGNEFIVRQIETAPAPEPEPALFWMPFFNMPQDDKGDPEELVTQSEGIKFKIEYKDGTVENGEIQ